MGRAVVPGVGAAVAVADGPVAGVGAAVAAADGPVAGVGAAVAAADGPVAGVATGGIGSCWLAGAGVGIWAHPASRTTERAATS